MWNFRKREVSFTTLKTDTGSPSQKPTVEKKTTEAATTGHSIDRSQMDENEQ